MLKRHLILICTILGAIAGYALLHPFGTVVHTLFRVHNGRIHLYFNPGEIITVFVSTFSIRHLPQTISYVILCGIIGFLLGKLIKSYQAREDMLQDLALIDELTGLYNRRGFFLFAAQLVKLSDRTQKGLVLIYADLNNLKLANDQYGHSEGDKVLVCVADVLKNTFRGSDIIGRMGGDEFIVVAMGTEMKNMDTIRRRLDAAIDKADCKKDLKCAISLSMGLVYYNPEQPCSIEELVRRADMLMYEEKKRARLKNA